MRWIDCTPSELRRLAKETDLCVVPIGSLERHGEHIPLGCDGIQTETIAVAAAEIEPCVVFPTWYWGQVHEASCFGGTVNFPPEMLIMMLRQLCKQIAANGFHKILFLSGHGGNMDMLHFFDMSTLDEDRDYVLYSTMCGQVDEETQKEKNAILETMQGGHADEAETSELMACRPGIVKMENVDKAVEPILPMERVKHLKTVHTGLWWYADYPENVTGVPSAATEEKGRKLLELNIRYQAASFKRIKEDTTVPALKKEFLERLHSVGK